MKENTQLAHMTNKQPRIDHTEGGGTRVSIVGHRANYLILSYKRSAFECAMFASISRLRRTALHG